MRVTTLMLADDAAMLSGKLYVHGGGWDSVHLAAMPSAVVRLALVLTLRVEYHEALTDQLLRIDLVDEDNTPAGGVDVRGVLNVGHAAGTERGAPAFVSQTVRFEGLPFEQAGRYAFRVFLGDDDQAPLAEMPFRVTTGTPIPRT